MDRVVILSSHYSWFRNPNELIMARHSSFPPILFDLDGTLVDTVYEHVMAWSAALREHGIGIPAWKVHRRIGMSGKSLARQLLREPEVGRRRLDIDKAESRHDAIFMKSSRDVRVLPGSQALLDHLSRNEVPWAVATTGNKKQTERLLRNLRLSNNAVVVTGDDVAQAKPAPDIFLLAAEKLGQPLENCIVVGDSIWDMVAGGRRRALTIGLLSGGYSKQELEEAGAFRVYADPGDMLEHIEDLGIPGN